MKARFTSLIVLWLFNPVWSQQIPTTTLYHNSISYYNPAYTSSVYSIRGGLQYRNQWVGVNGAPVTYLGQYEQELSSISSGIGVTLLRDEIGFITNQTAQLNYRYTLELSRLNTLSFGVSGGLHHSSLTPNWIASEPADPEQPGDGSQAKVVFNAGALLTLNRFKLGVSALQVNRPHFDQLNYRSSAHYSLTLDYRWLITRKFSLEPSLFFITDGVFSSIVGQLRANFGNKYWTMVGLRTNDAVLFGAGIILFKRFSLGYSLDVITSKLSTVTSTSHGIFLNYQIPAQSKTIAHSIGTPDF